MLGGIQLYLVVSCLATLYTSGYKVEPNITSICLYEGWLIVNAKSFYLRYKVAGDQFCGRAVSRLNPMTYYFSISCCYFGSTDTISAQLEMYIREGFSSRTCFDRLYVNYY